MAKTIRLREVIGGVLLLLATCGCGETDNTAARSTGVQDTSSAAAMPPAVVDSLTDYTPYISFLPEGFVFFHLLSGDLNADGQDDCVLIIKATDPNRFAEDEYLGRLDRNRRGILVLFNNNGSYELVVRNDTCFASENEEGGFYYAPELYPEIANGNLYLSFLHGRYGYWKYTFRYRQADFELIGYDISNSTGPVIENETSINFLTKKKQEKVNVNDTAESGEEVFKETWTDVHITKLIRLSEIKDFAALNISQY